MPYSIVGVVGHIDHGKTSLVAALTGIHTDTHPEEKQRGITIDLGFAHLTDEGRQFAFIDAPGHQKYIGNLLSGVSHVDIGLLVVACDQGIQAQTLEHVAILQALGVDHLVVVISRVDLCSGDEIAALTAELELFLSEYGFCDFPVLPVSSVTGEGLAELRVELGRHNNAHSHSQQGQGDARSDGPFRMPIDRVFTVSGRGCVVAGAVWTGSVEVGDTLQVARTGELVRVRELESHDEVVDSTHPGFRTAMNLTGTSAALLGRGDELLAPDSHKLASRWLAETALLADAREVRCPAVAQLHTGTTHVEVRITGAKRIKPDEKSVLVMESSAPLVATFNQRGLLRRPYPIGSFASVRILGALPAVVTKQQKAMLKQPAPFAASSSERVLAWIEFFGEWSPDSVEIRQRLGLSPAEFQRTVAALAGNEQVVALKQGGLVSPAELARCQTELLRLLRVAGEQADTWLVESSLLDRARGAAHSSRSSTPSRSSMVSVVSRSPQLFRRALQSLIDAKQVVRFNGRVSLASSETTLSKRQVACMDKLLEALAEERLPPDLKSLADSLGEPLDRLASVGRFAAAQGLVHEVTADWLISDQVCRQYRDSLQQAFQQQASLTASEIKQLWGVNRKRVIALLEYFDQRGFTERDGDVRRAGPAIVATMDSPQ